MNQNAFNKRVLAVQREPIRAVEIGTLQVNLGYRCNLSCKHCHLACGPLRREMMGRETAEVILAVLSDAPVSALDLTGGAPELNPHFRYLVREARRMGKRVVVRSNLAITSEEGQTDLPEFFRDHDVGVVASLPYYLEDDVDRVRGRGTFGKCIDALRQLNRMGYGLPNGGVLNLVYNPRGAFLAPDQTALESEYRKELAVRFGVSFTRLYVFTNMPIGRFREFLVRSGNLERYLDKLACAFNPAALDGVMCRHLVSVGWDGRLYDCDFNLALGVPVGAGAPSRIRDFEHTALARRIIETGYHCFGCAAGAGSS